MVERPQPEARTNDLDVGEDRRRLREEDGSLETLSPVDVLRWSSPVPRRLRGASEAELGCLDMSSPGPVGGPAWMIRRSQQCSIT